MASAWRVPLLLSLWFGLGCEVLAGSRTVPVQVTFVDVARHSASQSLTVSQYLEPGGSSPQLLADLQLDASGTKPLSIVVEAPGDPRGPRGTLDCVLTDPVRAACGGRLEDTAEWLIDPGPMAGSGVGDIAPARAPAEDLVVTISYH
jgi:hypothetical protein